jgi:hypothetical protein
MDSIHLVQLWPLRRTARPLYIVTATGLGPFAQMIWHLSGVTYALVALRLVGGFLQARPGSDFVILGGLIEFLSDPFRGSYEKGTGADTDKIIA